MIDEAEAATVVDAKGRPGDAVGGRGVLKAGMEMAAGGPGRLVITLDYDAAVLGGGGGAKVEGSGAGKVIKPVENLFVLVGGNDIVPTGRGRWGRGRRGST